MKKILIFIGLCFLASSLTAYDVKKPIFIKGPTKEDQKSLRGCSYYKITPAKKYSGFNYTCITLTKNELDWIVKKLNDPAIYKRTIDDELIKQLTMPESDLNNTLRHVLTDFKDHKIKKLLKTIRKTSTMQKIAEVLPQLMGQEY